MLSSTSRSRVAGSSKRAQALQSKSHTRNFRIGAWTSYLDPIYQKELQRRSRVLKYKYAASLHRKLSWDRQKPLQKVGWKHFMCGAWQWKDSRPGGRWVSLNELRKTLEDYTVPATDAGIRNASNVQSPPVELEYEIDAISGRKVFKKSETAPKASTKSSQPSPTSEQEKFRAYRSQFSAMAPPPIINLDGPPVTSEELAAYRRPYEYKEDTDGKDLPRKDPLAPTQEDLDMYRKKKATARYDPESPEITSDELSKYSKPYTYKEDTDGREPEKRDFMAATEQDLARYRKPGPVIDPEGPPMTSQEMSGYNKPYEFNEPDGKFPEAHDPMAATEEDLARYRKPGPFIDPDSPPMTTKEMSQYKKPFKYNEPDGKFPEKKDPLAPTQEELDLYRGKRTASNSKLAAFKTSEIDRREDLDLLRPSDIRARSGIFKSARRETEAEKLARRQKLEADFQESSRAFDQIREEVEKENQARLASKKVTKKMTGNYARDFPEEFSTSWTAKEDTLVPKAGEDPWGYSKEPKGLELSYQQECENKVQASENDYAAGIASPELFARSPKTTRIQTSLDRSQKAKPAAANVDAFGYSKEPCGLETSYKEECIANGDPEPVIFHSSYGTPTEIPEVKRENKTPQELKDEQRARDRELIREVRAIYEEEYGTIDSKHRQPLSLAEDATERLNEISRLTYDVQRCNRRLSAVSSEVKKASDLAETGQLEDEAVKLGSSPTVYKVLAYDSIMQKVNLAETTSIHPDNSAVLTPAEVLLRISNPTKFFPYFKPLRNQGFEIVSGSGDVLVFKKTRSGSPKAVFMEEARANSKRVEEPVKKAKQPFKSMIDVRRQEPVFSGGKPAWEEDLETDEPRPTRSVGKKMLIGAGWVAACSYAVGVVTEFFTTGGSDGLGAGGL